MTHRNKKNFWIRYFKNKKIRLSYLGACYTPFYTWNPPKIYFDGRFDDNKPRYIIDGIGNVYYSQVRKKWICRTLFHFFYADPNDNTHPFLPPDNGWRMLYRNRACRVSLLLSKSINIYNNYILDNIRFWDRRNEEDVDKSREIFRILILSCGRKRLGIPIEMIELILSFIRVIEFRKTCTISYNV